MVKSTNKIYQGSYRIKGSYWLSWNHHIKPFTVATMTWFTLRNICVTNDHGYGHVDNKYMYMNTILSFRWLFRLVVLFTKLISLFIVYYINNFRQSRKIWRYESKVPIG
jgi:hypothetical protein